MSPQDLTQLLAGESPDNLMAAIMALRNGGTAQPAVAPANPMVAPAPTKRTSKTASVPTPASAQPIPAAAPVQTAPPIKPVKVTAANGMKVDITDPYRKMVAFTHTAITKLRAADGNKSKGIHSVYSGFNGAFGIQFVMAKETVWSTVDLMAERGDIGVRWAKGGKMLYLPGEQPAANRESAQDVLRKILG